jgi:hypothetical protein
VIQAILLRLAGATSLYFREDLVDDGVLSHCLTQCGIQSLKQLRDGLVIATHERDPSLLSLGSQYCTTDGRDLADRDLTASVIEKDLDVIEACVIRS